MDSKRKTTRLNVKRKNSTKPDEVNLHGRKKLKQQQKQKLKSGNLKQVKLLLPPTYFQNYVLLEQILCLVEAHSIL